MRKKRRKGRVTTETSVEDEIAHLRGLNLKGLRARWQSVLQRPAPDHLPRHLLFAISQRALTLPLWTKTHISLTTVAGQSSMHFFGKIEKMVIAAVLFIAFAVATGAAIVKAYQWHQDVLYGPYLKRID
jgi:hypothetical protein